MPRTVLNQYTQITNGGVRTLIYDSDGNLTNDSVFVYTWDGENRLIQVEPLSATSGSKRVRCRYDYMSRRFEKAVDTWNGSAWESFSTNRFLWDGWLAVAEISDTGVNLVTNCCVWGIDLSGTLGGAGGIGGLLACRGPPGTNWLYIADGNGNITEVLDADAPTNLLAHYSYSPFGEVLEATGS